jgi:hypothetical protein
MGEAILPLPKFVFTAWCLVKHRDNTGTKLILLFNVIPLDFNAPVPASHSFFNSVRKNSDTSLTDFAPRQFLERIVAADETWVHHYEPESRAQSVAWKHQTSPVAKKFRSEPSACKIMVTLFFRIWQVLFWFISLQRVKALTVRFPYVWPSERSSKKKKKKKKIFIR